ncbi:E3 ubiquitin-protein ligase MARCHF2 isoform X6 [Rousettus aegyptiacus]|nr:E3 ubiquitin-protein ligase MARCHF2 isoform X6 [Rousettus aegyptiacus]
MQVLEMFHYTDEKIEAQRGQVFPRATQQIRAELALELGLQHRAMEVLKGTQESLWLLGPWASGPEDTALPVAMTTGDCCHLPGSLCDCSSSPAFSKVVEATGLGPPQYVAQVTSRDGRLLSTVIRSLDTPSDGPFCRICHEGANGESLLSLCGCTGTLGAVHKSCLERWLSSSNTSYCELCHTEFAVEKRPRPLTEWLKDPGPRTEKRTLCCDMVSFRYHCQLYTEWRRTNQKVRLKIRDADGSEATQHSLLAAGILKKVAEETPV